MPLYVDIFLAKYSPGVFDARGDFSNRRCSMLLLEPGDVAKRINRSAQRVRDLVEERKIEPFATTPRGVKLFREEDVAALVENRRRSAETK
jgi:hypothetical protein